MPMKSISAGFFSEGQATAGSPQGEPCELQVLAMVRSAHGNTSVDWLRVLPGLEAESSGRDGQVHTFRLPTPGHTDPQVPAAIHFTIACVIAWKNLLTSHD